MSAKQYITASRKPSPAYVEMSAMLADMNKQIDELREILDLMVATSKAIKAKAAKADGEALAQGARPVDQGALAGMFPGEGVH